MTLAPEQRLLTRTFALAWLGNLCHSTATAAYVHLPGFLHGLGASEVFIGSLSAVTAAVAISLRPIFGAALDRVGRRVFIIGAGALHVALCLLYLAVGRLGPFVFVVRAAHGVVEAVIFSILFTYVADVVPASRRTEGLAWFGVSAQIPIALGGLGGDFILARSGYPALFLTTAACALVGLVVSLPLEEPSPSALGISSRGVVACLTQRDLLPLWLIGIAFATAVAPVFTFLKTFVIVRKVGSVGLFLGLYAMAAGALRLFFGWTPDRFGAKKVLAPAIVAVAAGMWLLGASTSAWGMAGAGMLVGAGHGLSFPIIAGLVVDRALPAERPIAMALVTSVFDVGQLIGGPLFGAIIQARSHQVAFSVAAVIAAAGLVVFVAWDRSSSRVAIR